MNFKSASLILASMASFAGAANLPPRPRRLGVDATTANTESGFPNSKNKVTNDMGERFLAGEASIVSATNQGSQKKPNGNSAEPPTFPPVPEECAIQENGLELFPQRDPRDQKMKLVQSIDTDTCTYELALSFKPDNSIPFIDYPTRPLPDAPCKNFPDCGVPPFTGSSVFTDVPANFTERCYSEGYDETSPGSPLTPEKHVGFNTYYTEYTYTLFTHPQVAEKTGYLDVVLGAAPCGQGSRKFPGHSVHFYTKSRRGDRQNYRCKTGGGFFCKPDEEQCSDRAKKFDMKGDGLICNEDADYKVYPIPLGFPYFKNLPAGWVWTVDGANRTNAAAAGQGLHAVFPIDFSETLADIPQHLLLQYDGELIANHVIMWSGFSKGLSRQNKFTREFNFTDAADLGDNSCTAKQFDNIATSVTNEYDPITGRTTVTARGKLKHCSGPSFTKVIDHSQGSSMNPLNSLGNNAPQEDDKSTCGRKRINLIEPPTYIKQMKFENASAASLHTAGDYDVFQDPIFTWVEVTDQDNSYFKDMDPPLALVAPFGFIAAKLVDLAGEHRGTVHYIQDQTGGGPSVVGGFSPSVASSDIKIDHPDYGKGTIKVFGYSENFGEGELAITGGTGDFVGAYGTVKPYYGLLFKNDVFNQEGIEISDAFIAGRSLNNETIYFASFLSMDFKCTGAH